MNPNEPWMSPAEYGQIEAALEALQPHTVVEWGSGGSTLWFPDRFPSIDRWVSVEHDLDWYRRLRDSSALPKVVELLYEAPDEPGNPHDPVWYRRSEFEPGVFQRYVERPTRATVPFYADLVFVDGRARNFCMRAGFKLLNPGGVVVVHDAQRREYAEALSEIGARLLPGWTQGQVAIARKP